MYVEIMRLEGVHDLEEMERLRVKFTALVAKTYPAGFVEHLHEEMCMGCAFEHSGPRCRDWAKEALVAVIHDRDPPPAVFKTWIDKPIDEQIEESR
jgi:hypothetical protein